MSGYDLLLVLSIHFLTDRFSRFGGTHHLPLFKRDIELEREREIDALCLDPAKDNI